MKNSNQLQRLHEYKSTHTAFNSYRLAMCCIFMVAISPISEAQWGRTAPNVYLTTGSDKVGIGTTTPQTKLYINDQTPVSSFTGITSAGVRIHGLDNASNNYALLGFSGLSPAYNNRNLAQIGANFTSSGSNLFFGTCNSYGSGITNTAMTINHHGYVGIGTTVPTFKLDVNGDVLFNGVRVGKGNGGQVDNTVIGNGTLNSNTTGTWNVATGYQALFSNTVGFGNAANGYQALYSNTTGYFNTAIGRAVLYANTTGSHNTATGIYSLLANTTGINNTANGGYALYTNTTGNYNTGTGYGTLSSNTTGFFNTACGLSALEFSTTGSQNTAVGLAALNVNTTGHDNSALGAYANVSSENLEFATAIGAGAIVTASNTIQLGSSTTTLTTSGGYTIVSDGRFKDEVKTDDAPGLAFINKLRPVTYSFNYKRYDNFLRKDQKTSKGVTEEYKQQLVEKAGVRQAGFIAQEVEQVCRENKFTFNGVYAPQNSNSNYALDYSRFVVPLVKAVQELSLQNDLLKEEINQLKAVVYAGGNMKNGTASIVIKTTPEVPLLGQNIPNPAANNTIIPFRIPKNCSSASIVIAESGSGKIINAIPVSCGETHLAIDAGSLAMGSYTYSLYINGKLLDSKQMILAK